LCEFEVEELDEKLADIESGSGKKKGDILAEVSGCISFEWLS
jgi:hypothetical protein